MERTIDIDCLEGEFNYSVFDGTQTVYKKLKAGEKLTQFGVIQCDGAKALAEVKTEGRTMTTYVEYDMEKHVIDYWDYDGETFTKTENIPDRTEGLYSQNYGGVVAMSYIDFSPFDYTCMEKTANGFQLRA